MDTELTNAIQALIPLIYKAGLGLFIVILFKDMMADFAQNIFIYLKMRFDKKTYSAEGGKIMIGNDQYVIIDITLGYIHLKKVGNGKRCRMTAKQYWSSMIVYMDNRELQEK